MPTLPLATAFTGTVTEAAFKAAITDQREFVAGLLGTAGTRPAAATALGSLFATAVAVSSYPFSVTPAHWGNTLNCTGTGTLNLPAVSGNTGLSFAVVNSGTGVVTLDGSGIETIDGVVAIALTAGNSCLVACDGISWKTVGRANASGMVVRVDIQKGTTYAPPANCKKLYVFVRGATAGHAAARGGSAGGGYAEKTYSAPLAASYALTIGAAGVAGSAAGSTTFNTGAITVPGGAAVTGVAGGLAGASPSGGDVNFTGGAGGLTTASAGAGGGGSGASRAGNGYAGGAGYNGIGPFSGGGGGSGGVGGAGTVSAVGAAGASATTENAGVTAITECARSTTPMLSGVGTAGGTDTTVYIGDGYPMPYRGGRGATCTSLIGSFQIEGAPGGVGGSPTAGTAALGSDGSITILEVY